jgi:hypothetical protein
MCRWSLWGRSNRSGWRRESNQFVVVSFWFSEGRREEFTAEFSRDGAEGAENIEAKPRVERTRDAGRKPALQRRESPRAQRGMTVPQRQQPRWRRKAAPTKARKGNQHKQRIQDAGLPDRRRRAPTHRGTARGYKEGAGRGETSAERSPRAH